MARVLKNRYELLKSIGFGGTSEVYLALDRVTGDTVAVKIMDKRLSTNEKYLKRFIREINIAKTLNHPNIPKLIDYGLIDGVPYLVTEYIRGKTLKDIVEKNGPLSLNEALRITKEILKALSYAHSKGIVAHRDIKPSNIMIDKDGNVKVMDFGIAKVVGSHLTQSTLLLTPQYASPEQIKGEDVDIRSDIYSLGITLYYMLTGRPPYEGDTPYSIFEKQIRKPLPKISDIRRDIPKYIENIIEKATSKNPNNRYRTPYEMMMDLERRKETLTRSSNIRRETYRRTKGVSYNKYRVRSNTSLIVITVSIIAVITVGLLFFVMGRGKGGVSDVGYLSITSNPSGAKVYIDNNESYIGITPIDRFEIEEGEHRIRLIKDGYEEYEEIVDIERGKEKRLDYILNEKVAEKENKKEEDKQNTNICLVSIASKPNKAEVYINGKYAGLTPINDYKFIPGRHNIEIKKKGYETYKERIQIKEGEGRKKINVVLAKIEKGTLSITSDPSGAKVYVDGEYKGTTPLSIKLKAGTYSVVLKKRGYEEYATDIIIKSNKGNKISATLKPKIITWEKTYGGRDYDGAYSIQQTRDGGYIVAGGTQSFGAGREDVYIIKLDENGNKEWEITYGGEGYDAASSIQQTKDGGYIVAGSTNSFGAGAGDFYILKLDENGNLHSQKSNYYISSIFPNLNSHYLIYFIVFISLFYLNPTLYLRKKEDEIF